MKALTYTLILSAVLLGCIVVLLSLDDSEPPPPARPGGHPVISSQPAAGEKFSLAGLEESTAEELLNSGRVLFDLWHTREATALFEQVVAKDSTFLDAYLKLIECYSDPLVCREDEARESWRWARELAAGRAADTLFVQALGDLYIHADYEAAARKFEAVAEDGHRRDNARYYLAVASLKGRDLENAEKNLRQLLQADNTHGRAYELLIHCAVLAGSLDEAESLAKDLAVLYSEEPFPYVLLSRIETLSGRDEEALSFCLNALSLDPGYIPAILCRGNLYLAQGQPEAARVSFEKLLLFDDPIMSSVGSESIAFVDFLWGRFDEGAEMMDEAIRYAMLVGSVRRGLNYTSRFVDYLLQLGRSDRAEAVINRWFSGFGEAPNQLGNLRLDIFNGDLDFVRLVLEESARDRERIYWMRILGIDPEKVMALAMIKDRDFDQALETLGGDEPSQVGDEEYFYLRGYAAFEKGEAELAAASFKRVLGCPYGLEFPYHQNPVFYTQTLFYLAEAAVARGDQAEAVTNYTRFLGYWDNTDWEMPAVGRAREKLNTLQNLPADNQ